jgi:hypothetical protein
VGNSKSYATLSCSHNCLIKPICSAPTDASVLAGTPWMITVIFDIDPIFYLVLIILIP